MIYSTKAALAILSLLIIAPALALAEAANLYVQVQKSKIRAEPKHWAAAKVEVKYGQSLEAQDNSQNSSDNWLRVKTSSGVSGFIHASAVTKRKVLVSPSAQKSAELAQQSKDVVLAGKGFNPEVEREYAERDSSLNFAAVDRMEKLQVSDSEIKNFMTSGKLIR